MKHVFLTILAGFVAAFGTILVVAFSDEIDSVLTSLVFKLIGAVTLSMVAAYFIFLAFVVLWIQKTRHEH